VSEVSEVVECDRNKFCCGSSSENAKNECPDGFNCVFITKCSSLLMQFKNGLIDRKALREKSCGEVSGHVCCQNQGSSKSQGPEEPDEPVNTLDENSPAFIPRRENEQCGLTLDRSNVVGGNISKPGRYPFVALIGENEGEFKNYLCGGTVINRWYVLSAAHCFFDEGEALRQGIVNVGDWDVGTEKDCFSNGQCLPPNQIINIQSVVTHPGYNTQRTNIINDIALVKLQRMIDFDSVIPACLPLPDLYDLNFLRIRDFVDGITGIRAHVVGWGHTNNFQRLSDFTETKSTAAVDKQHFLPMRITNESECHDKWSSSIRHSQQICAGGVRGQDSCRGDSGGPLVINKFTRDSNKILLPDLDGAWYVVGIVSFGTRKCGVEKPAVFVRVSAYMDWIKANMK